MTHLSGGVIVINMNKPLDISQLDTDGVRGLFFDIDDTFTTDGKITADAFNALWRLYDTGIIIVPITGRPAGWCDHIARMWPVTAVVGENGAFYFQMKNGRLVKQYLSQDIERKESLRKLEMIRKEVLQRYPQAALASDQSYREFDLAIDFCEDVLPLPREDVLDIYRIFKRHGAKAKISSIHVNGWFGNYTKFDGIHFFAEKELDCNLEEHQESFIFCGDSPNDEPLFHFFSNSVGVANVLEFKDLLEHMPRYLTPKRSGAGFAQLAAHLAIGLKKM